MDKFEKIIDALNKEYGKNKYSYVNYYFHLGRNDWELLYGVCLYEQGTRNFHAFSFYVDNSWNPRLIGEIGAWEIGYYPGNIIEMNDVVKWVISQYKYS